MLHENIAYFGVICCTAVSLKSVILRWDPKAQRICILHGGKGAVYGNAYSILYWKTWVHATLLFLISLQGYLHFRFSKSKATAFTDKFLFGVGLVYLISGYLDLQLCRKQAGTLCLYVNGMLSFGNKYCHRNNGPVAVPKSSIVEWLNKMFAYAFFLTMTGLPVVYLYGLHWNDPCRPSVALYWLVPECNGIMGQPDSFLNLNMKIPIFLLNHWTWSFCLNVGLFVIAGIQILCSLNLRCYIIAFETISTSSDSMQVYSTAKIYRNIQVLATLMNEIQQKIPMSVIVIAGILAQSISMTTVVKLPWTADNVLSLTMYLGVLINCIVAMAVTLGGMAGIFAQSERTLKALKKDPGYPALSNLKMRWKERFYRSCMVIKVRFGSINFVDQLTPLNCIDFANELTLQLLLVGK